MIIIPIGIQCTNKDFLKKINKTYATLPFDWMLSNPKFVYEMLYLLLDMNMNINELVLNHFFKCDNRANWSKLEHYYTCDNGLALCNTLYNVIFPHDEISNDTINKYVRRFERLKNLILESDDKLIFIYSSQSSLEEGNFTINKNEVITEVYLYLSKIYELIGKYRNKYKLIVFDSINQENTELLNKNIILCKLNSCISLTHICDQMYNFKDLFSK